MQHPDLMVGFDTSDDACVYRISDTEALVETVDFFPPVVDDAYAYGQIAATNALSDVYAMGGTPFLAMNLLCIPMCMPQEIAAQILAGGYSKVLEAGAIIAGGHSIRDDEPKYGLCVTGRVHPMHVWANRGAKTGDALILTKALGTGILTGARKGDAITEAELLPAIESMTTLNKAAAEAAAPFTVHACTDITGFGLLGHVGEMAAASGVTLRLFADKLPLLPQALALAAEGYLPGGGWANANFVKPNTFYAESVSPALQSIAWDPQTSGGLLFAVPQAEADALLAALLPACPYACIIGSAEEKGEHAVIMQ